MFNVGDYRYIQDNVDKSGAFSLQKETEYPMLRIDGLNGGNSDEYSVTIRIKQKYLNTYFDSYDKFASLLKCLGYPVESIDNLMLGNGIANSNLK